MDNRRQASSRSMARATVLRSLSMAKPATCALPWCNGRSYKELIELQNPNVPQQTQSSYSSSQGQQQKPDLATKLFDGLHGALYGIGTDIAGKLGTQYEPQPYGTYAGQGGYNPQSAPRNRFGSFATLKNGNDVKWYVDGCSYMWAVSKALEGAKQSIWILDCRSRRSWQIYPPPDPPAGWLSPELYLRRPPSKNEQYRLDRMLQQAAQRGVRVNVIVYKEVRL